MATLKPETTKIVQITSNAQTVYGLGSDEKMYQWNFLDSQWHLYAALRDREEITKSPTTTEHAEANTHIPL
jgi:hypothetical protein